MNLILSLLFSIACFGQETIKVMVIDTGIEATHIKLKPYINPIDVDLHPLDYIADIPKQSYLYGHGTHIAGIVTNRVCKQVQLISCRYIYNYDQDVWKYLTACLKRARDEKVQFINFSSYGQGPQDDEYKNIALLLSDNNVTMVVAAGNDNKNMGNPCYWSFPGCYNFKNLVVVGNLDTNGFKRYPNSNYGYSGMKWMIGTDIVSSMPNNTMGTMTGTSQAAARYTNELLKQKCEEINHNGIQ